MLGYILSSFSKIFSSFSASKPTTAATPSTIKTEEKQGNPLRKPELIDLHFNGLKEDQNCINCSFWDKPSDDEILKLRKYLYEHNVKAFLPTLITASAKDIKDRLTIIAKHKKNFQCQSEEESLAQGLAYIPGVHIEGGYISRTGTHPKAFKEALGPNVVKELAEEFPKLIKIWTICPRVDKDGKHVETLRRYGITPSYGHSEANYQEAMEAFDKYGVRLVTHWGNGMNIFMPKYNREDPSDKELEMLTSKDPELLKLGGLGKAAYDHPEVYMMAICGSDEDKDFHISPKLIKELSKTGRLILVTDAVARPAGSVSDSGCQTRGYKLAGGQVALDKHVLNAKRDAGLTDEEIHKATIENPSKVLTA